MTIFFGLLSAFSYGLADFVGAIAAKRIRALAVTTISFSFGLGIALVLSQIIGATYSLETLQASVLAGVCSAIAISCLYAALALGPISIVSPLTAVISAIIPVVFDVASGQALSGYALLAVLMVLVAVVLVGFVPSERVKLPSVPALLYSLGAGLGFAGIFVFLDSTSEDSGLAPLVIMRAVGLLLLLAGLGYLAIKHKTRFIEKAAFAKTTLPLILVAGTGDVLGNVFFLIATREGALAVAAILTSLYPIGTILLAWVVLKERIAASQIIGIVLGLAACALLALG